MILQVCHFNGHLLSVMTAGNGCLLFHRSLSHCTSGGVEIAKARISCTEMRLRAFMLS